MGRQIFSFDETGITEHNATQSEAVLYPRESQHRLLGRLQYDPREIGFMTMAERFTEVVGGPDAKSAKRIERSPDETIIEIRAQSALADQTAVIECSSKYGWLPVRIYYVLDDARVSAVTDIKYQEVSSEPEPVWFLESAVRRHSFPHNNTSPDDNQWGQTATIMVTDVELDTRAPPPRDKAKTLPPNTVIQDLAPSPSNVLPEEPPLASPRTLTLVIAVLVAICAHRRAVASEATQG